MWTPILLCLFVGLTTAEYGWKAGTKYDYSVEGRTLTGLHQVADQYSGVLFRAKLTVQAKTDDLLSAQINEAEFANLHANLSGGWTTHVPDEWLNYEQLPIQRQAFELKLNNGVITGLTVSKDQPDWAVNLIKSIASQLQVDTQGVNQKKSSKNQIPQGDEVLGLYKTMEDSVNGIYETDYAVSPLPEYIAQGRPELVPLPHLKGDGQFFEIVKNRNFSNAKQHLVYRFGLNGQEDWNTGSNHMGNFLSRSSVSRVIISGNVKRYTIQSSVTSEKVVLAPHLYNEQKGIVASRMNLTLQSVTTAQEQAPEVTNPITLPNLVYEGANEGGEEHVHERIMQRSSEESSSSSSSEESNSQRKGNKKENRNGMEGSRLRTRRSNDEKIKMIKMSIGQKWHEWNKARKQQGNDQSSSSSSSSSESSSSSSSDSSSTSSSEEYLEPNPSLQEPPSGSFMPTYKEINQAGHGPTPVEKVVYLSRQVAEGIQNPTIIPGDETLSWFTILNKVVASMSAQEMNDSTQKLFSANSAKLRKPRNSNEGDSRNHYAWTAFRDSVAQAGTGPALVTLKNWITSGKVQGEEAAELIAVLPQSARYPNTEYMNYFFELVKDGTIQNQWQLNNTALLSFAELVRKSQVDHDTAHNRYSIHLLGHGSPSHSRVVEEQYVPYFQKQLQNAVEEGDSVKIQTYIRVLGSIAHPQILTVLKPYLEGSQQVSTFQRLMIVASLDEMTRVFPNKVRPVLYTIYQNEGDKPEIRVAAVVQLMKTNPSAQILQRMAQQTNYDQSKHVNAAVKSAIETAAVADNVLYPQLSRNARGAANLLTSENFGAQLSKTFIQSYLVKEQNLGYNQEWNYIQGENSILPKGIFYHLKHNIGGFNPGFQQYSYGVSSADDILRLLWNQFDAQQGQNRAQRNTQNRNQQEGTNWSQDQIDQLLNMEYAQQEQVEGNVFINTLGTNRLFTFDNHTIEQLTKIVKDALNHGKNYEITKLYNQYTLQLRFPTATGHSFIYSLEVPTLIKIIAQIKGGITHKSNGGNSRSGGQGQGGINVAVNGDYQVTYSAKKSGHMGFYNPYNGQSYIAAVEQNVHSHLPVKTSIEISYSKGQAQVNGNVEPLQPGQKTKLFEYSNVAYTAIANAWDFAPYGTSENIQKVNTRATRKYQIPVGQGTGFAFDINVESQGKPSNIKNSIYNALKKHNLPSCFFYQNFESEIINSNYSINYNPEGSTATQAKFSFLIHSQQGSQHTNENIGAHKYLKASKLRSGGNVPVPTNPDTEQRRQEFLNNVQSGIQDANTHLVDASITFDGRTDAQYVVSAAFANSDVSDESRFLALLSLSPGQSSGSQTPLQATLQWNGKFPRVPFTYNYNEALQHDPTSYVEGQLNVGEGAAKGAQIKFQGTLKQSQERQEYIQNHPVSKECEKQMQGGNYVLPICRNATLSANFLDQYQLTIQHEGVPTEYINAAYQLYALTRQFGFQYNTENIVKSHTEQNTVNIGIQLAADLQSTNISIETPTINSVFQNIQLNEYTGALLVAHPQVDTLDLLMYNLVGEPICALDLQQTNTFNNVTYPIRLGQCWHVLAIHNESQIGKWQPGHQGQQGGDQEGSYTILAKDIGSNQREVQIVLGNDVVTLTPSGSNGGSVAVNGQNIQLSSDKVAVWSNGFNHLRAYNLPGSAVKVQLTNHGIGVTYDGARVLLRAAQTQRGTIHGLCGSFGEETTTDFRSPQQCILGNPLEFAASYAINDESCEGPAKELQQKVRNEPCYKQEVVFGTVVPDTEMGHFKQLDKSGKKDTSKRIQEESCANYKVMVIEDSGKTCFSVRPQMSCGSGCQSSSKIEKMLDFHCLSDSAASRHWAKMVAKGANPDFSQKGVNLRTAIRLPERCVPNMN